MMLSELFGRREKVIRVGKGKYIELAREAVDSCCITSDVFRAARTRSTSSASTKGSKSSAASTVTSS